ncbi:MAG: Zn-dependent membrane protease YugP [Bacteroidia bacterium]|jgi:Zn-dependent membrane protease YugP|tara:strand:- start:8867 stop:9517 length:651 start_codon:yes stop_codon:yes gene_type:complete
MGGSWFVQNRLKSKFKKYSQTPISSNLSGKEIAEKMLADHGLYDVKVISVNGQLTDHYNPAKKTVNLSESVYNQRNAAAAAVAAHEVGHAVQHARSYAWLNLRSKLVPAVSISSKWVTWVLLAGIGLLSFTGNILLLQIAVAMFAVTTLFSFVTLPVEFDASNRALAWIEDKNIARPEELSDSKDALKWAAMTYVVAALSSLVTLLYYASMLLGRD